MSSEFTQLCEMYRLSPADPEAIDILIEKINSGPNDPLDEYVEIYYDEEEEDLDEEN